MIENEQLIDQSSELLPTWLMNIVETGEYFHQFMMEYEQFIHHSSELLPKWMVMASNLFKYLFMADLANCWFIIL